MKTEMLHKIIKALDIGYHKICNCPLNHINCSNPKDWIKGQVAIWEFFYEKRDIRDKNVHPAVFPIGLPTKCINYLKMYKTSFL